MSLSYLYVLIPVGTAIGLYVVRKIREWQWGWVSNTSSLKEKLFIITGANTGLGLETTKALLARNASVIMACRNPERMQEAIANIRSSTSNGEIIPLELDLASFESINIFAAKIKKEHGNFTCLINNAGLAMKEAKQTENGFELHFGVNHLGHFLLTKLLDNNIQANKARIVVVASKMHERGAIDFETMARVVDEPKTGFSKSLYNDSKLANFYFARELFKRGNDAHVLCPGLCHTEFFRSFNPKWYHYVVMSPIVWFYLRSAVQGAQNIIYCATENENSAVKNPSTGYYVTNLKQTKSKFAFDENVSVKLWDESIRLLREAGQL